MTKITEPKNLIEAVQFFSDEAVCVDFIASLKWDEGKPCCPKCGSLNVIGLKTRQFTSAVKRVARNNSA